METKEKQSKKIVFLFGAGCEGSGQLGLASGADFKRGTIVAEGAKDLFYSLNNTEQYKMDDSKLLHHKATSILYQTLMENDEDDELKRKLGEENIDKYIKYKNGDGNTDAREKFREIYSGIYNEITSTNKSQYGENAESFLEIVSFFSYADSLLNYIRKPELYPKETAKVMKLYYAAFRCILKSLDIDFTMLDKNTLEENRKKLSDEISRSQDEFINKNSSNKELYYNMVKDYCNADEIGIITTNYTHFAQSMIGLKDESVAYLHGRLEWFEDVKTKEVKNITEHDSEAIIFPFIFVQSGVKPIVSTLQIKEYSKAVRFIDEAEDLYVIGYAMNSDDEHIVNLLKERVRNGKRITVFAHEDKDKYEKIVKNYFGETDNVLIKCTKEFLSELEYRKEKTNSDL